MYKTYKNYCFPNESCKLLPSNIQLLCQYLYAIFLAVITTVAEIVLEKSVIYMW